MALSGHGESLSRDVKTSMRWQSAKCRGTYLRKHAQVSWREGKKEKARDKAELHGDWLNARAKRFPHSSMKDDILRADIFSSFSIF